MTRFYKATVAAAALAAILSFTAQTQACGGSSSGAGMMARRSAMSVHVMSAGSGGCSSGSCGASNSMMMVPTGHGSALAVPPGSTAVTIQPQRNGLFRPKTPGMTVVIPPANASTTNRPAQQPKTEAPKAPPQGKPSASLDPAPKLTLTVSPPLVIETTVASNQD